MVSKVFEHPFDLTKVRLQSQVLDRTTRFDGPLDCLKKTWQKEGLRGLYRVRISLNFSVHVLKEVSGFTGTNNRRNGRECFPFLVLCRTAEDHLSHYPSSSRREATPTSSSTCRSRIRGHNQLSPVSHKHPLLHSNS